MKTQTTDERCEELRKNIKLLGEWVNSNSAGDNKELREHHVFNFGRQSGLLEGNEEGRLSAKEDNMKEIEFAIRRTKEKIALRLGNLK